MDAEIEIVTDDIRLRPPKSEVERLFASNSKAQKVLGWSPDHGGRDGFLRGIGKTVEWFTELSNLSNYKAGIYNI
jgi:dTDP-glucose 4,6-dehydratase